MATVSRTTLTCSITGVLLIPVTLVVLLQGLSTSSAHATAIDDFGDSLRVTFDPAESCNLSSTVDVDGDIHIVWEDYRSGNGDIYYVKLDSEGNKLTNDAKISNDSEPSLHPSVAVDSAGHIYIVWESIDGGTGELYFAKLWYYAGNITFQVNGLQVSDGDPAHSGEPEVAVCADGNLAVVWTDARYDTGNGNLEVFYKRLSTQGTAITPDLRVTNDVGVSERPNLDVDPDGRIHVVWYDFRDSDNGLVINHGVFYRKLAADGNPLTNETRITFASVESTPDVAVDTDGNVHVVFDDDRYATFDTFYTLLDNEGNTLVDDRNISPKDEYESRYPRISLSDSSVIDVVWQDHAVGIWAIHYSAMSYDGTIQVYDQTLTGEGVGNATGPVVMCAKDNNTMVVYIGEAGSQELFFCRTHRPDAWLQASDIVLSASQPLAGSTLWVNATIRNSQGDTLSDLTVHLLVDGVIVDEASVASIPAGEHAIVPMSCKALAGSSAVSVVLDPYDGVRETDEDNNEASVPILVRVPGLSVTPDAWSRPADPGGEVQFNLTVMNTGNSEATYIVSNSTLDDGWTLELDGIDGTLVVGAGESIVQAIAVTIPEGTVPGTRTFTVDFEDAEQTSVNETLTLLVDVRRTGQVTVTSPPGSVMEPTLASTCTFVVENLGNSNESFVVSPEDERGWMLSASHDSIDLSPGVPAEIVVTVVPARYEVPGTLNELTLWLISENLTTNTGEGTVLLVTGHHRELQLSLSQQAFVNYSVPDDQRTVYDIDVCNLGNSEDTVRLNLSGEETFWAVLNTTYLFLDPGESGGVILTMTPGTQVLAGPHTFNLSATSETDSEVACTMVLGVNVQPYYEIVAHLDRAVVSPDDGDSIWVNMTIENLGNIVDTVDIYPYSDSLNGTLLILDDTEYDLESSLPPPVPLEPGGQTVLTIVISVPAGAAPGDYILFLDITSLNDPTAMAFQTVTLTIPEKGSWLNLYVIVALGAAAAGAGIAVFLLLRRRAARERERLAEERRRAQRKSGARPGNRKTKPRQGGQGP